MAQLLDVVRSLAAAGITVVVVEQSVNVATSLAGRAVFMERGQVRFSGPTAELVERPDLLRSVFLGAAAVGTRPRRRTRAAAAPVRFRSGEADRGSAVALDVSDLSKAFGGVAALDGVTLSVAEGEIVGIIGANGSGKTTLLDVCSGFMVSDSGRVRLWGQDVSGMGAAERADHKMGRVFQDARLFPSLTVAETLAVALETSVEVRDPFACLLRLGSVVDSEGAVEERVEELLEEMGLERFRDSFISELSTGTRRIVELGCALAHRPSVLLLDEPSSGIAQRESEALGQLLLRLREQTGATFVVVEHDVPLVSSMADRLICLDLGRVIAEGRPEEVLAEPAVVAAYLGTDAAAIARSGSRSGNGGRTRGVRSRPKASLPAAR
ncbi:MAG: ABC transporter ATP-binding protein [Acidimicrobiales bacterium]